jgi:hypothetical protein
VVLRSQPSLDLVAGATAPATLNSMATLHGEVFESGRKAREQARCPNQLVEAAHPSATAGALDAPNRQTLLLGPILSALEAS